MKFAVVEYSSKSQDIWKHTSGRPNFLADPQNEMDPTSFGCYVSAMEGEHIPLLGLILGPVNNISPPVRTYRRLIKKLSKHWPKYSLDYLSNFDVLLVVHQMSDAHELSLMVRRLKQSSHPPLILGVCTQPYGLIQDAIKTSSRTQTDLKNFMEACDVFLSIVKSTTSWYQGLTSTPVVYMPQPYPVEYAQQFFQPAEQKLDVIYVAGITSRPRILLGHEIALQLKHKFPDLAIHVTRIPGVDLDLSILSQTNYRLLPFEPWQQHLKYLSQVKLVINTDRTKTRGRVQVDCAAVGTPSIGADSDAQADLFPSLPAHTHDHIEGYVDQATHLLLEQDTYTRTVNVAQHQLKKYDYSQSRQRIVSLVNKYSLRP